MDQNEVNLVRQLTNVSVDDISFSDRGSFSRCYIINDGEIVFKFKKRPDFNYYNEAYVLDFLKSEVLNVKIQSVGWRDEKDRYLGMYGVIGTPIKDQSLEKLKKEKLAKTLAHFIEKIQRLKPENTPVCHLEDEIKVWQTRYTRSLPILNQHLSSEEMSKIDVFMKKELPKRLLELGERLVFSHGDLWENNIFTDKDGEVGVIDFSDSGYYDEAAELMYFEDDELCNMILDELDADAILREKVRLRRLAKAMFITSAYVGKPEEDYINYIEYLKKW